MSRLGAHGECSWEPAANTQAAAKARKPYFVLPGNIPFQHQVHRSATRPLWAHGCPACMHGGTAEACRECNLSSRGMACAGHMPRTLNCTSYPGMAHREPVLLIKTPPAYIENDLRASGHVKQGKAMPPDVGPGKPEVQCRQSGSSELGLPSRRWPLLSPCRARVLV